jgi:hypothetical protein
VSLQTNFTWSHCISDAWSSIFAGASSVTPDNRRADRSDCATSDTRRVFNVSGVTQIKGWQVSTIMRARSAQLFTVTSGVDRAFSGEGNQRPNLLRDPYSSEKNADHWLDAAAFGTAAAGTYGNLGRNNMKGPSAFQFDMGLTRSFQLRERASLQLRGEAFNVLNKVNLSNPVSSLNSGSFGKIQSAGSPRIIQLALKLVF